MSIKIIKMLSPNCILIALIFLSSLNGLILDNFIPSQANCIDSICYTQTLVNPVLVRANKSRCIESDECINTILIQQSKHRNSSRPADANRMMILVCSKMSLVNQVTLSLNLNGEMFKNSFSFSFALYECLDCANNLVEKIDSWIEEGSVCSAFEMRTNLPFNPKKKILYLNRIGYYLTLLTNSKNITHYSRTSSFIYPQSFKFEENSQFCSNCLFFRGEHVNEQCLNQNDCTGRLMINDNLSSSDNKFIELKLANPLNRTDAYYLFLIKSSAKFIDKNEELFGILISNSKEISLIKLDKDLNIKQRSLTNNLLAIEDRSQHDYLEWIIEINYENFLKIWDLERKKFNLRFYGGFDIQSIDLNSFGYFQSSVSKSFGKLITKSSLVTESTLVTKSSSIAKSRTIKLIESKIDDSVSNRNQLNVSIKKTVSSIKGDGDQQIPDGIIKSTYKSIVDHDFNSLKIIFIASGLSIIVVLASFCVLQKKKLKNGKKVYPPEERDAENRLNSVTNVRSSSTSSSTELKAKMKRKSERNLLKDEINCYLKNIDNTKMQLQKRQTKIAKSLKSISEGMKKKQRLKAQKSLSAKKLKTKSLAFSKKIFKSNKFTKNRINLKKMNFKKKQFDFNEPKSNSTDTVSSIEDNHMIKKSVIKTSKSKSFKSALDELFSDF